MESALPFADAAQTSKEMSECTMGLKAGAATYRLNQSGRHETQSGHFVKAQLMASSSPKYPFTRTVM